MIENRKEGLNKVTNVMAGIRDLAIDTGKEVDMQGNRLEDVNNQLDDANKFTNQGAK
jgi:t-SNARE complex subunit (syntaxin)